MEGADFDEIGFFRALARARNDGRYPTPAARLAYVRRAYRRWTRQR